MSIEKRVEKRAIIPADFRIFSKIVPVGRRDLALGREGDFSLNLTGEWV
jgi:hypothetical protein